MNREDIIKLARQAGYSHKSKAREMTKEEAWDAFAEQYNHRLHGPSDAFKFAWDAATKAEREACAKVCEEIKGVKLQGYEFAAAIRARSGT